MGPNIHSNHGRLHFYGNNRRRHHSCKIRHIISFGVLTFVHYKLGHNPSEKPEVFAMTKRFLRQDSHGILLVGIICISFIIMSSLIWLAGALIVSRTFDAFMPWFAICDPRAQAVAQQALNAYGVSIIVVDICFIIYWGVSSQKNESVEGPAFTY
jgi:hypothetical protein